MNSKQRRLNRSVKLLLKIEQFQGYSYRQIRIILKKGAKMLKKDFGYITRFQFGILQLTILVDNLEVMH